jgi:hypothetical protein
VASDIPLVEYFSLWALDQDSRLAARDKIPVFEEIFILDRRPGRGHHQEKMQNYHLVE